MLYLAAMTAMAAALILSVYSSVAHSLKIDLHKLPFTLKSITSGNLFGRLGTVFTEYQEMRSGIERQRPE